MQVIRIAQRKTPLCSMAVQEIFQRVNERIDTLKYEILPYISPSPGDVFLVNTLESPLVDNKVYTSSPDVFREAAFDAVIEKTKDTPSLFRFVYYNRKRRYRIVHYLIVDQDKNIKSTPLEEVADTLLTKYSLVRDILFPSEKEKNEIPAPDMSFWQSVIERNIASLGGYNNSNNS